MAHRVLLVREMDVQASGSGCCGRLGGVGPEHPAGEGFLGSELGDTTTYAHTRADMEAMGAVYRAIRDAFSDEEVEITVVDPRNSIWLVPAIWRDARRSGATAAEAARVVARGVGTGAVICDGRIVVPPGEPPEPRHVVAELRSRLAAA